MADVLEERPRLRESTRGAPGDVVVDAATIYERPRHWAHFV